MDRFEEVMAKIIAKIQEVLHAILAYIPAYYKD